MKLTSQHLGVVFTAKQLSFGGFPYGECQLIVFHCSFVQAACKDAQQALRNCIRTAGMGWDGIASLGMASGCLRLFSNNCLAFLSQSNAIKIKRMECALRRNGLAKVSMARMRRSLRQCPSFTTCRLSQPPWLSPRLAWDAR